MSEYKISDDALNGFKVACEHMSNAASAMGKIAATMGSASDSATPYLFERAKALAEENGKMREALLRLRRWNMGGNFDSGVVGDLLGWIDGGMVGDLPEYPDYLPPL